MKLEGSCHCGAVSFSVISHTPHPYNHCYCSICRKTGGGSGSGINIMGDAGSLEVQGEENVTIYRSSKNQRDAYQEDGLGSSGRRFCKKCGSNLWSHGPDYPDFVYPFASAIDTPLPEPAARTHLMLAFKPDWVSVPTGQNDKHFEHYPDEGIEDWHRKRGLYED